MKPTSSGSIVIIAALTALGGLACSDASPTQTTQEAEQPPFVLSESAARAFADALNDVRVRLLPSLEAADSRTALGPLLDEITTAIGARNASRLGAALDRSAIALARLEQGEDAAAIAVELDAVRLIIEHARPLVDSGKGSSPF